MSFLELYRCLAENPAWGVDEFGSILERQKILSYLDLAQEIMNSKEPTGFSDIRGLRIGLEMAFLLDLSSMSSSIQDE